MSVRDAPRLLSTALALDARLGSHWLMPFTFEGETLKLTSEMVHRALAEQLPGEAQKYWVDVDGVRWPVKEAVALSTGLARTRFTSQQAQRWLKKAGFTIQATSSPSLPTIATAVASAITSFDVSSLEPLSSHELSVEFTWLRAGELSLDGDGLPLFSLLPASPGLYRFDFGVDEGVRALYIGESSSLRRRVSNYRNAKTDRSRQRTSRRIHNEVVAHLGNGGSIEFAIATEILVSGGKKADLRLRSSRRLAENAAVLLAQMTRDVTVMNIDEALPNDSADAAVD